MNRISMGRVMFRLVFSAIISSLTTGSVVRAEEGSGLVRALDDHLREQIVIPGESSELHITIQPHLDSELTKQGHLKLVEVRSKPAKVKSVYIDDLYIRVRDVRISPTHMLNLNKLLVTSSKESHIEGVLSPTGIEQIFAAGRHTKDMKIKVSFTRSRKVMMSGIWTLLGTRNPFQATSTAKPSSEGFINLHMETMTLNGVKVPRILLNKLENLVNGKLDKVDLPFNPQIRQVKITDGRMNISSKRPADDAN